MQSLHTDETVVLEGTYLYGGSHECDIRIVRSPVRFGTGDHEDPPEWADDFEEETFYLWYGSTTERGVFNAGGGGFPSLEQAMAAASSAPGIGHTVRWREQVGG